MSDSNGSDDRESKESEDTPDSEEDEEIDIEEFFEQIEAQRDEQQEQVSYNWCETIRDAGERYRELKNIDDVVEDLSQPEDEIREALTVYRLIFEEPPGTAASIASRTGRAFFAINMDADESRDGDDSTEDLVREYVGSIYLEYDVDENPVGDPVHQRVPEHPANLDKLREMITEVVSTPASKLATAATVDDLDRTITKQMLSSTQAFTAATVTDELNEVLAQQRSLSGKAMAAAFSRSQMPESLFRSQTNLMNTEIVSMVDLRQELLQVAMSPVIEQLAQHNGMLATTAVQSLADSFDDIGFPSSVLADLAAIQPSVGAAAPANSYSSLVFRPAVSNEVLSPTAEVDQLEASSSTVPETDPIEFAFDVSHPDLNVFSTKLTLEIPTQVTYFILTGSEAREWFVALPANYQRAIISGLVGSTAYSLTLNWGAAGFAATTLTPLIRQMLLKE